jgi:mRNA-degrading endonuclease HigB of HigAB toxin-antitoxin module
LKGGGGNETALPSSGTVGRRAAFKITGNKCRLFARVNYQTERVFVLYILTQAE